MRSFKYLNVFITIIYFITLITSTGCTVSSEKNNHISAQVLRVIDGDTFIARVYGRTERIRLLLIDTPETVHPTKPVEPFGKEASNFTKKILENQTVSLELDVQERDQYRRILAYVYLKDGTMLNEQLLKNGLAKVVVFPPNVKYVDPFRRIQKEAQHEQIGMWKK